MGVQEIHSQADWDAAKAESTRPVIVERVAPGSGPCYSIAPVYVELAKHFTGPNFYKLDVTEVKDVAAELHVRATPTFVVFLNGENVDQFVGADAAGPESLIRKYL